MMHQCPAEQTASLLPGGHRPQGSGSEFCDAELLQDVVGSGNLLRVDPMPEISVNADAREETREDDFERSRHGPVTLLQILRNDADVTAQLPDIPSLAAEDADPRVSPVHRVK